MDSYISPATKPLYRAVQIIWYILGIIELLLAFRFLLRLTGAKPVAAFTALIYNLTYPLIAPFIAVFRQTQLSGVVFEWTTLLAMLVYWFIAWAIIRLFLISKPLSTPEAAARLEEEELES